MLVAAVASLGLLLRRTAVPLTGSNDGWKHRRLQASSGLPHFITHRASHIVRKTEAEERFAALYHADIVDGFKFSQGKAGAEQDRLISTLKEMEVAGITTVHFSVPWDYLQADSGSGLRYSYLDWVVECACQNTQLKVALTFDLVRAPGWVFEKFPEARSKDSQGRSYQLLSWFHAEAQSLALEALRDISGHLAKTHRGCVTAINPVFNNEYEAKYTQEHDCYQDYSDPANNAFRAWIKGPQGKEPRLEDLNLRWHTSFKAWEEVVPPMLEAPGSVLGIDLEPRFWDWIRFREEKGAEVLNRACAAVQESGLKCFHHLAEVFSVLNAVYGATMFQHLAASPHTDYIVVGTNFRTPFGTVVNPTKVRLMVASAQAYGKPVHFQVSVEQMSSLELLEAGFQNALLGGASGLGISSWYGRLELNSTVAAAFHAPLPNCKSEELVGVFVHLESCSAWHGMQWNWARKDPLHDFAQDLADSLAAPCGNEVAVYLEMERFLAEASMLDRVIFVEPLVLRGDSELDLYAMAKVAARSKPHEIMYLPANQTNGVQLTVLQAIHH